MQASPRTLLVSALAAGAALTLDFSSPRVLLGARLFCLASAAAQVLVRRAAATHVQLRNDTRIVWLQSEGPGDVITVRDRELIRCADATRNAAYLLALQVVLHLALRQDSVPLVIIPLLSLEQTLALPIVRSWRARSQDAEAESHHEHFLPARPETSLPLATSSPVAGKEDALRIPRSATPAPTGSYEEAVAILQSVRIDARTRSYDVLRSKAETIPRFEYWLNRLGYMAQDLDALNAIHITGSKGKGSTAAFASSILKGIAPTAKIGRYTSPQLVTDRERISINGEPLSPEMFAKYFFQVWKRFENTDDPNVPEGFMRPTYFWTLTLMAFHVFLQEGCEVSIIEVGAGARSDCTNILQKPLVSAVGIIGLAHVGDLGRNTREIAYEKAGIYKRDVPGLTMLQDEYRVHKMVESCARSRGVSSFTVVDAVEWLDGVKLGLAGPHQRSNAALALYMVQAVLDSDRCPAVFQDVAAHLERPATFKVPMCLTQRSTASASTPNMIGKCLKEFASHPLRSINFASALASVVWVGWEQYKLATSLEASRNTLLATAAALWVIALAHRLCCVWVPTTSGQHGSRNSQRRVSSDRLPSATLSPAFCCGRVIRALENTRWPARAEVFQDKESQATLYLDAAHTPESMKLAGEWFAKSIADEEGMRSPSERNGDWNERGTARVIARTEDTPKEKARNILVVTVPGGVADADKLIEGVLRGSTMEKDIATGRPKLAFDKVIATSDAVRRPGDFVLETDYARQLDVLRRCKSILAAFDTSSDFEMDQAETSQHAVDMIRSEGSKGPCNVLVCGSIHLVGHLYDLMDLPLRFVCEED